MAAGARLAKCGRLDDAAAAQLDRGRQCSGPATHESTPSRSGDARCGRRRRGCAVLPRGLPLLEEVERQQRFPAAGRAADDQAGTVPSTSPVAWILSWLTARFSAAGAAQLDGEQRAAARRCGSRRCTVPPWASTICFEMREAEAGMVAEVLAVRGGR